MGAAFLSAGGYHHHIGMNTLNSLYGKAHIRGEAGLENFAITIPNRSSFNTIKSVIDKNQFLVLDPDGIQIVFKTE
jgi:catechol 2,3-dioxygenase